jgi:hypothetical protein
MAEKPRPAPVGRVYFFAEDYFYITAYHEPGLPWLSSTNCELKLKMAPNFLNLNKN